MTPQLRFPEFNDGWQVKKLGDVFERVTRKNKENNQNILTISAQDGLVSQEKFFSKIVAAKNVTTYYLLHRNDYAYNKSYSKGYPMGAIKRLSKDDKGVVSTLYICFSSKQGAELFFDQYFEAGKLNTEIEKIAQEGARNHGLLNMSVGDFFSMTLTVPSKPEQEKIADFLTAVDERIAVGEKKLELLETYKRGVMQQIFSQQVRFKDENGEDYPDWEEKKLGEISVIKTGKKDANIAKSDGEYRFYTCSRDYLHTDVYSFEGEAILVAGNADVGLCHYYNGKFEAYQRTYVLQNFKTDGKYLYKYLSHFFRQYVLGLMQSSAMTYITLGTLENFTVPLPSEEEQQKIATFLTILDDKITAEKSKLTAAREFKKALLQRMFV